MESFKQNPNIFSGKGMQNLIKQKGIMMYIRNMVTRGTAHPYLWEQKKSKKCGQGKYSRPIILWGSI